MGRLTWAGKIRRGATRRVHAARRLASLSPGQRWRLLRAQLSLVRARLLLALRETGALVETESPGTTLPPADLAKAREWALMVRRAAVFGVFRPTCLVQSIALTSLLESEGLHGARIRVGVRQKNGAVQAHAWVEYGGEVIGDFDEHVASFIELTDVRLIRPERS